MKRAYRDVKTFSIRQRAGGKGFYVHPADST